MTAISPATLARVRRLCVTGEARSIREGGRLSPGEVARALGTSTSTVWRWEHLERTPRGDLALRYLALLEQLRCSSDVVVTVPSRAMPGRGMRREREDAASTKSLALLIAEALCIYDGYRAGDVPSNLAIADVAGFIADALQCKVVLRGDRPTYAWHIPKHLRSL